MADEEPGPDAAEGREMGVRDLRRRWKPIKEGPAAAEEHEPIRIRLHRCCSWLQYLEQLDEAGVDADEIRLIYGWIALNSLYGTWNAERREPISDGLSIGEFQSRLLKADRDGRLRTLLIEQKPLVTEIVGDEFLSRHYWQDPGESEVRRAQGKARQLSSLYVDGCYTVILDMVLRRVYLARCQIVHGAATHGSKLNRLAVHRCAAFLGLFLTASLLVIIDHAWDQDWGDLCYPPMQ